MDFFRLLKSFIPSVSASEQGRGDLKDDTFDTATRDTSTGNVEVTSAQTSEDAEQATSLADNYCQVLVGASDPERFPERQFERYRPKISRVLMMQEGREEINRNKCERRIHELLIKEPLIRLLVGALESSGCKIDFRRNFSCEVCREGVVGAYDTETQQIVLCMNRVNSDNCTAILAHELIHMYDHCVNKTDFKLPEHLACTEIRAANLTGCSLKYAYSAGYVSLSELICKRYEGRHAECVKDLASRSMVATSSITIEEARKIIDKVFPFCYNDLEPVGRRLKHNSLDGDKAFNDGKHYGYV